MAATEFLVYEASTQDEVNSSIKLWERRDLFGAENQKIWIFMLKLRRTYFRQLRSTSFKITVKDPGND